jgi:drug/metabolite transporter (DMT)-like permease
MNLKMNNELLGIFYMILCQFSFATNDALVKILYQNYNDIFVLNQVIFLRGIFALFFIGFFLFLKKKFSFEFIFSSGKLRIRGLLEAIAAICFFIGIAKLPFAMVYVLLSLAPVILTVFGALILKEKVRWRRWTAVIIGFIGVIVVINPGKLEFGFYFIFPLLSAFFLSLRDIYTKKIKSKFHSLQIAFITCLVVTICFGILNVYKIFSFSLNEYIILFISSFFLSLGYIFSIATIKVALVSVTSTFRYSVILWGILYGYFLFNEIPNNNTYIGAFMIVVSGLIIISRQRKLGQLK